MNHSSCVVFITAIEQEFAAVRDRLGVTEEVIYKGTIYETGRFTADNGICWQVAVAQIGMGNDSAATETERAIEYFKPSHVFFTGVAGGIHKDLQLGDVVAANKVYGYEAGKVAEALKTRPDIGQPTHAMIQRAQATARKPDWQQNLEHQPKAIVKPIAAGNKVITNPDSELCQLLRNTYNDAVAVEMEGIGFLEAAYRNKAVEAIVIRGISDLLVNKAQTDAQGWQEIAAQHAAAFAFAMLHKLQPPTSVSRPPAAEIPWYAPYLMNYQPQQDDFRALIQDHRAEDNPQRSRPLVCLLHGREGPATADGLVYRLKRDLEKHCLPKFEPQGYHATLKEPCYFDCGEGLRATQLHKTIAAGLRHKLNAATLDTLTNRPFDTPMLFYAQIDSRYLSKAWLEDFLAFWQVWVNQNHLFLVCLFVHYRSNGLRTRWKKFHLPRWMKKVAPNHGLLPLLEPMSADVVTTWAYQHLATQYLVPGKINTLLGSLDELFPKGEKQRMEVLGGKLNERLTELSQ